MPFVEGSHSPRWPLAKPALQAWWARWQPQPQNKCEMLSIFTQQLSSTIGLVTKLTSCTKTPGHLPSQHLFGWLWRYLAIKWRSFGDSGTGRKKGTESFTSLRIWWHTHTHKTWRPMERIKSHHSATAPQKLQHVEKIARKSMQPLNKQNRETWKILNIWTKGALIKTNYRNSSIPPPSQKCTKHMQSSHFRPNSSKFRHVNGKLVEQIHGSWILDR